MCVWVCRCESEHGDNPMLQTTLPNDENSKVTYLVLPPNIRDHKNYSRWCKRPPVIVDILSKKMCMLSTMFRLPIRSHRFEITSIIFPFLKADFCFFGIFFLCLFCLNRLFNGVNSNRSCTVQSNFRSM